MAEKEDNTKLNKCITILAIVMPIFATFGTSYLTNYLNEKEFKYKYKYEFLKILIDADGEKQEKMLKIGDNLYLTDKDGDWWCDIRAGYSDYNKSKCCIVNNKNICQK